MAILLLAVALGSAWAAGFGVALLVAPGRGRTLERASLAFPLGLGFVAVTSWLFGYMLSGIGLRVTVLTACVAVLAAGVFRTRSHPAPPGDPEARGFDLYLAAFLVVLVLHTAAIASLVRGTVTNWDGLLVWEFKARITAQNEGVMPREYFSDSSRAWTHPYYPPLQPLAVAWIYGWIGRPNPQHAKTIFPALHAALLGMLFVGGTWLGGRRVGLAAPLLMIAVPEMTFGEGGVASGLVDYTVAAYFLPAAVYVALLWSGDRRALPPLGALCTVLPLIKQEGIVHWAVIAALAAIGILLRRPRRELWMLLPGLTLFIAWRVHLVQAHTPRNVAFDPTAQNFIHNLSRVPLIFDETMRALGRWDAWSLLWLGVVLAVPGLLWRRRTDAVLLVALVGPVALLSASYVVTNWDVVSHIRGSLARLLVQVAPVAVLVFALGMPSWPSRREAAPPA